MRRGRQFKELSKAIFGKTVFGRMDGIDYVILGAFILFVLFATAAVFYSAITGIH